MKQAGVYICQSLKNQRYYIGSADEMERRLEEHNRGKTRSIRFILPLQLKVFIPCPTIQEARQAEYKLKKYKLKDILKKIIKSKKFPWEYEGD